MTTITALLTNKAYGYPTRGARRRRKPTILACLHQTANAKATASQERTYANRAGSVGPSATAYIDRDGTIVRAIDPAKYAAWSQGDASDVDRGPRRNGSPWSGDWYERGAPPRNPRDAGDEASDGRAGGRFRWAEQAELHQQTQLVGDSPVLDESSIAEASLVEHGDLQSAARGRPSEDAARVDAAAGGPDPDLVTLCDELVDPQLEVTEPFVQRSDRLLRPVDPVLEPPLVLDRVR